MSKIKAGLKWLVLLVVASSGMSTSSKEWAATNLASSSRLYLGHFLKNLTNQFDNPAQLAGVGLPSETTAGSVGPPMTQTLPPAWRRSDFLWCATIAALIVVLNLYLIFQILTGG